VAARRSSRLVAAAGSNQVWQHETINVFGVVDLPDLVVGILADKFPRIACQRERLKTEQRISQC